ncbi:iron chelate uptake ABC transporter family permease subunit [Shimia sp. MMG029]|uniref:iron chelate uptake ABC transporter family permease subunit n=1 Tax=Shimia sp. MMG029 TaxID=3021978 RepID=UPI0022FF0EF7|nr:iron chelate uptake ABC transporter family permease subunit [Shimia sp. MMG029]MDA5558604.1 iron chelate uptake ABC transporter family permease subunit [Shimia sp. MMG029]
MRTKAIWISVALLLVCAVLFMTLEARGSWEFVLWFRGRKLVALLLVGAAISTSTLLFQTIARNNLLTPSIMGFDALYTLILTLSVFFLGSVGFNQLPPEVVFLVTVVVLIAAALALFGTLLGQHRADLMRMVLTGIIFGVLFRSLTAFGVRMIDPNEFVTIQVKSYARFNYIDVNLLWMSLVLSVAAIAWCWHLRRRLDVLALGFDIATNLGEAVSKRQTQILILIALLVAVSTALVGPVAFLGLLVVSLARLVSPNERHATLIPLAALIAGIVLVGGQTLLERVFDLATPLSVVVDFVGGFVFLVLLLRKART